MFCILQCRASCPSWLCTCYPKHATKLKAHCMPLTNVVPTPSPPLTMQAVADSKGVSYRIFGNTTQAQNGVARFTGLTVNGKPGDTVRLTFRTQNGLTITRDVIMRECQAGEYTDTSASAPNEQSFRCAPCQSPQFSFYPKANSCSQCASLPVDSFAACNLAALVPADGFYQSHPRSPVVSCVSHSTRGMRVVGLQFLLELAGRL